MLVDFYLFGFDTQQKFYIFSYTSLLCTDQSKQMTTVLVQPQNELYFP